MKDIEILGREFDNVVGFKMLDTEDNTVTYTEGGGAPTLETVTKTYTPTESQQTETITPSTGYDGISEVDVTVNAISSSYVGTGITRRSSSDLSVTGATVIAPAGYYQNSAIGVVAYGSEGTPTATKGTVSNHSVSVTPAVTNTEGYISGGTQTGTAVTVSASELDSGTKSITANGVGIDVVGYASVDVNVSTQSGYTAEDIAFKNVSGDISISGSGAIKDYAFYGYTQITSLSAPNITELKQNAFYGCDGITSVSLPTCTKIGNYAFYSCDALKTIGLPSSNITLGTYSFYNCWALENIDFSKIETIPNRCFSDCWVKGCSFNPVTINDSGFRDAEYMGVSYFPRLTTINGTYALAGTYDSSNHAVATSIVMPALTSLGTNNAISYCNVLAAADIGNISSIPAQTFRSSSTFATLVLRKSSVVSLANINAFESTPFASAGRGGTLYVPQAILNDYTSSTNWRTILGYTNNQIKSIESTATDPDAPIDLTTHYIDGTLIPT